MIAPLRRFAWAVLAFALGPAACSGNLGSGGLPLQAPQGGFSPNAQAFQPAATRERTLEGAVYLTPEMSQIPFPQMAGFAVSLQLGTAPPSASPSPVPSATATGGKRVHLNRTRREVVQVAQAPEAQPSASPSSAPSALASAVASSGASAASPSAGSPSPASSAGASAAPKAHGSPKPGATSSPSGPKIDTKLVIYPDDAPALPTPAPTGNVQVFQRRLPIVRAYLLPHAADIDLYGLAAIRFTVPKEELPAGRGFTVAVFEAKKKYRGKMIAADASAAPDASGTIASTLDTPLVLHKGSGYYLVLFGDQLAPTPLPSGAVPQPGLPAGYATPANNPYGSYGTPNPYATLNPYATANPYATQNPYATAPPR